MITLLSKRTVRARKPHTCWICGGGAVVKGQMYERASYAADGTAYTLVSCLDCAALNRDVWDWSWSDEGIGPDEYQEWAEEHSDDPRAVRLLNRLQAWREVCS